MNPTLEVNSVFSSCQHAKNRSESQNTAFLLIEIQILNDLTSVVVATYIKETRLSRL